MSELIDRIFDAEKISKEIADILSELGKLKNELDGFSKSIDATMNSGRKAKTIEDLTNSSKELNNTVINSQKSMKTWEDEVAKLNEKTKLLTETEKQGSIEIAKARLELQAAQKATKEDALAKIELTANNGKLDTSYNGLVRTLKVSMDAYKKLSEEERNSSKGKELLGKIGETQVSLKKTDEAMGNYQRNVGNYKSAVENLTPKLGGLAGTLLDIAQSAKQNAKDWEEMGDASKMGFQTMGQAPAGLAKITAGFKGLGQMVVSVGKAILANPILLVVGAIVAAIKTLTDRIQASEERSNKLSMAFSRMKPILTTIGTAFDVVADIVIGFVDIIGKAITGVTEFLGLNPKGSGEKFAQAEKMKQDAILKTRKYNEDSSKQEAIIAEQRAILADKENYSYKQRQEALKKAGEAEKKLSKNRLSIAELNQKSLKAQADLDVNNAEMNDKLSEATIALTNAQKENAETRRKLGQEGQTLAKEHQADLKAEADAAKASADKIIQIRRRLIDSTLNLMDEGSEKQIKIEEERLKRELEDLQRNGELTRKLKSNLEKASQNEISKIKKDEAIKLLNEDIKANELVLENMEKAGKETTDFQKYILTQKMDAEIKAGADALEVRKKYSFLMADLDNQDAEKKLQAFEKLIKKESEILSSGYSEKELALKKDLANNLITQSEYEAKLLKLKSDFAKETNDKTIELLKKELEVANVTEDKRAEISNKIAQLQIENENAVVDATIKANEKKVNSDKEAFQKRIDVAKALMDATAEIFNAIADYQIQQSENRIQELEEQQTKSDEVFEKEQSNLDKSLMSDEHRAEIQKQINEDKAKADEAIANKIKAEKIKQAKWDKANALTSAIISTALAVLNGLQTKPFIPLGLIAAGLAGVTGGIQIAKIASQPITAYEKGGITKNEVALWGEKRPEIAVNPKGQIFYAETPTISKFDAGTQIYKSVSDYEKTMSAKTNKNFSFDYDKMAEKIPSNNINLNGEGLWAIISKEKNRETLINRRYSL